MTGENEQKLSAEEQTLVPSNLPGFPHPVIDEVAQRQSAPPKLPGEMPPLSIKGNEEVMRNRRRLRPIDETIFDIPVDNG